MTELGVFSMNSCGLSNDKKRREVFYYLQNSKHSLFILQETHSTPESERRWKNEWGGEIIFSHGENNTRGVCIMLKNNFNHIIHESVCDEEGRYVILDISVNDLRITLAALYAPNHDCP